MPVTSLRKPSARPPEVAKIKIKIKIKIKSSAAPGLGRHRQNSTIRVKCRPRRFQQKDPFHDTPFGHRRRRRHRQRR
ncbi:MULTISPECIES: hypothetical protein [unclassified Pseudomonas]|uniref:hypothetical protein n=1 Tax=unclassified Pseudomonas TaxID=196821 RepID=UPI001179D04D